MDQVSVAKSEFRIKRKRSMNIQKRFIIHISQLSITALVLI